VSLNLFSKYLISISNSSKSKPSSSNNRLITSDKSSICSDSCPYSSKAYSIILVLVLGIILLSISILSFNNSFLTIIFCGFDACLSFFILFLDSFHYYLSFFYLLFCYQFQFYLLIIHFELSFLVESMLDHHSECASMIHFLFCNDSISNDIDYL